MRHLGICTALSAKVIIDMATLTGACIVALGYVRSGLYSNNEDVIFELEQASEISV